MRTKPSIPNIYLTGFMGSGKSFTGKRLADLLNVPFLDLDQKIEQTAGKAVSDIFATEGEVTFRSYERDALRSCAHLTGTIIATGGGAPCFHQGMEWMNDQGITVFLDPELPILLERLTAGKAHRPLLNNEEAFVASIRNRLAARRPTYEKAQLQLRITDPNAAVARYLFDYFTTSAQPTSNY